MKFVYKTSVLLAIMILQFSVFPRFWNSYLEPDLLLILIVLFGLHKSPELACLTGFTLGLLNDVNTGGILGSNAFIWAQIAMLNSAVRNYLLVDSAPVLAFMAGMSYLLAGGAHYVFHRFTAVAEPGNYFFFLTFSRAIITAIFTWPMTKLFFRNGLLSENRHA